MKKILAAIVLLSFLAVAQTSLAYEVVYQRGNEIKIKCDDGMTYEMRYYDGKWHSLDFVFPYSRKDPHDLAVKMCSL